MMQTTKLFPLKGNVIRAIEIDRSLREHLSGREYLSGKEIGPSNELKTIDILALIDVVMRVSQIKQTDLITTATGVGVFAATDEIAVITPRLIRELLGIDDRKKAWKIMKAIEGLSRKILLLSPETAITPLIAMERQIYKIHPFLNGGRGFVLVPEGAITRIVSFVPPRTQRFVVDVYFFLLNHRHNACASISTYAFARAFPTSWARHRKVKVLREKIRQALEILREAGMIVEIEEKKKKEEGWKVLLWQRM